MLFFSSVGQKLICLLGLGTQYLQIDLSRVYYLVSIKKAPLENVLGMAPFYNLLFCSFMELTNINSDTINTTRLPPQFDIIK